MVIQPLVSVTKITEVVLSNRRPEGLKKLANAINICRSNCFDIFKATAFMKLNRHLHLTLFGKVVGGNFDRILKAIMNKYFLYLLMMG